MQFTGFGEVQPPFGIGGEQPFVEAGQDPEKSFLHLRKGIKLLISKKATDPVAFCYELTMPLPLEQSPEKGQEKVQYKLYNCDHLNSVNQLMVFLPGEYKIWLQLPPRKIDKIDNMIV